MYLTSHAAGWTAPVTWKNPCPHSLRGGSCLQRESTGVVFIDNTLLATGGGYGKIPALITRGVNKDRAAAAVYDTHAHEMAEIKTMLYEIIKVQAEQHKCETEQLALITEQKAFITHMLTTCLLKVTNTQDVPQLPDYVHGPA